MAKNSVDILLLEDSADDAELINLELEKLDFEFKLHHATDKDSYLDLIDRIRPDIVLSDYNIPGYDIFSAKEALADKNIDVPVIVVTGALGDERAVELIVNNGVSDYILKGNLTRLNSAISRELNNWRIIQDNNRYKKELEKLSLVASHSHNGVIITDKDGRIEWVNNAFEELTGYSLDESTGKKPGNFLQGPDTNEGTIKRISENLDNEISFNEEILNYRKTGESYWVKLDISPVLDDSGNLVQYIAIQEDITVRKRTEQELIESYRQLKRSQEIGNIGSWTLDIETGEAVWSEQMYRIYEFDPELGTPSSAEVLNKTSDPDAYTNAVMVVEDAIKKGNPYDITVPLDLDKVKYVRVIGVPKRNGDGKVSHLEGTVQDVTEIKLMQDELENTLRQLKAIANNIDGVLMQFKMNPDGSDELLYISGGVENIFGISRKKALEDNTAIWENVHEDDLRGLQAAILESAENLSLYSYEWRQNLPGGSLKYLQARGTPAKEDNGATIWNTVILDITDQKKAEIKEKELQNLLQSSLNEIYIFDANTLEFIFCNETAVHNTKYTQEELYELTPLDIKFGYNLDEFIHILSKADEEEIHFIETFHRRKDGTDYKVQVQLRPEIYKERKVYVANVLDISDKVKAQEFYKETNQKLRQFIDAAPIGIYLIDTSGKVIGFWNPAAEEIFGYSKEEVLNNFMPIIPHDKMQEYEKLMESIRKGKKLIAKRLRRIHKSGKEIDIEINTAPIYKEGELYQILILAQDITELVNKEKELVSALNDKDFFITGSSSPC